MEAVNGVSDTGDKSGPPPPSPLTGCYLLIVIGEPHCGDHKDIILQKVAKGLLSWDVNDCLVDLEKELAILTEQALEGEEARYGERLIQFASENLVTEILIHPVVSTLVQCMRNLLSSFTRHRHIIHAGYTFANNGSWILQDGTFSLADFSEACQEAEVLRVIRAYENGISIDLHCATEGDWTRLPKEPFAKGCKIRVNPNDILTAGSPSITNFINYIEPFVIPAELENILECSDVVGNIRFSRPTLYVFPGGQGDAALFGINGFNMLLDGGCSRKACFWDFVRHLDRLDAVLLTRLNNSNVNGISAVLKRKKQNAHYPQIGHFFCNIQERKAILSPDGDKDKDPLLINLLDEGQEIINNLRHLSLAPQVCYRDSEPINLYHKVGHGTLDMYVLSPAKDSKEVREFLQKWNSNDQKLFATTKSKEFVFPLQNLVSICALLVWQPANADDTITRILFPGSSPQNKIFEGLDRIKNLEFIKYPVCSEKTLAPSTVIKSKGKESILERFLPSEKKISIDNKKEKPKLSEKTVDDTINESDLKNGDVNGIQTEKVVKKSDSIESEKSISKTKRLIENGDKPPPKPRIESKTKLRSDSQQRKVKTVDKKPSPTTPKKTAEKIIEETKEPKKKLKASPSSTPAKSAKEASNRKVVESKIRAAPKKESTPPTQHQKPTTEKKEVKVERKPISRRPKETPKVPASPSKKVNGVQKPDSVTKRGKLDKEGTTDSSTVSTPSADQESVLKKDISKMTSDELQNLKAQELADLKEEQEAVKEIEAVFRKGEQHGEKSSDFRKVKDLSVDDKLESEEYLIIEKTEVVQGSEQDKDTKEEETQKLIRDSEESEKQKQIVTEIKKDEIKEKREEIKEQIQAITAEAEKHVKEEQPVEIISKEISATSPEEKIDLSTDKKTTDKDEDIKEPAPESQPDEKGSANIESGATTTAPTLPEDERIPLDEIKEDNGDQIEEKHVKEDTKEKDVPVIQLPPKTFEGISKLPPVVGIRLDKQTHIRDIVKTPDEVADLPVHEEVDIDHYDDYGAPVPKVVDHKETDDSKKKDKPDDKDKDFDNDYKKDEPKDQGKELIETAKTEIAGVSEPVEITEHVEKVDEEKKIEKDQETSTDITKIPKTTDEDEHEPKKEEIQTDVEPAKSSKETPIIPSKDKVTESPIEEVPKEAEIIEKSEFEVKEKTEEDKFDTKQLPEVPKHDILLKEEIREPLEVKHELAEAEKIKETKLDLEKIDEKSQKLKEKVELDHQELIIVDYKVEKPEHAEPVIISSDSKPETPIVEDKILLEDKAELGKKSPKEREEDVAKIVASVAEVLKSDAPLEEFEGKIPFTVPCKTYTTELRETHITTVESPLTDENKTIKDKPVVDVTEEPVDAKSVISSFIESEQKIAQIHEKEPETEMIKDSKELTHTTPEVTSSIKPSQPTEPTVEEKHETEDTDGGIVHRMLVTTSSEDGGEEIEICPAGTITFSKSSESSGRSSPDMTSQKLSQKSSIVDTTSDVTTVVKSVKDLQSGTDSGIEEYSKEDVPTVKESTTEKEQVQKTDDKVDKGASETAVDKTSKTLDDSEQQIKTDKEIVSKETKEAVKELKDEEGDLCTKTEVTGKAVDEKIADETSHKGETVIIDTEDATDILKSKDFIDDKAKETTEDSKSKPGEATGEVQKITNLVQDLKDEIAEKTDVDKSTEKIKEDVLKETKEAEKPADQKATQKIEDVVKDIKATTEDTPATLTEVKETIELKKDDLLDKTQEMIKSIDSKADEVTDKTEKTPKLVQDTEDKVTKEVDDLIGTVDKVSKEGEQEIIQKAEVTVKDVESVTAAIGVALTGITDVVESKKDEILDKTHEASEIVETKAEELTKTAEKALELTQDKKDDAVQKIDQLDESTVEAKEDVIEKVEKVVEKETGQKVESVVKAVEGVASEIGVAIKEMKEGILKPVEETREVAEEEITKKAEAVTERVESTQEKVAETIDSAKDAILDKVEEAIKDIESKPEEVTEKVEEVLEPIQDKKAETIKKIDDIKESTEKLGEDLAKGVKEAEKAVDQEIEQKTDIIDKNIDNATKALDAALTDITDTATLKKDDTFNKVEENIEKTLDLIQDKKGDITKKVDDVSKSFEKTSEDILETVKETEKVLEKEIDQTIETAAKGIESTTKDIETALKETKEIIAVTKDDVVGEAAEIVKSVESKLDDVSKKIDATVELAQDKKDEISKKIDDAKESTEKIGEDVLKKIEETENTVAQKIGEKSDATVEGVESTMKEVDQALSEIVELKKDEITGKASELAQDKKDKVDKIIDDISKSAEEIKESKAAKETEDTIEKFITKGITDITTKIGESLTGITQAAESKKDEVLSKAEESIKNIEDRVDKLDGKVEETAKSLQDKKNEVVEKITDFCVFAEKIKDEAPKTIEETKKELEDKTSKIVEEAGTKIEDRIEETKKIVDDVTKAAESKTAEICESGKKIIEDIDSQVEQVESFVGEKKKTLGDKAEDIKKETAQALEDFKIISTDSAKKAVEEGKQIEAKFVEKSTSGILNKIDDVLDDVKTKGQELKDVITDQIQDKSDDAKDSLSKSSLFEDKKLTDKKSDLVNGTDSISTPDFSKLKDKESDETIKGEEVPLIEKIEENVEEIIDESICKVKKAVEGAKDTVLSVFGHETATEDTVAVKKDKSTEDHKKESPKHMVMTDTVTTDISPEGKIDEKTVEAKKQSETGFGGFLDEVVSDIGKGIDTAVAGIKDIVEQTKKDVDSIIGHDDEKDKDTSTEKDKTIQPIEQKIESKESDIKETLSEIEEKKKDKLKEITSDVKPVSQIYDDASKEPSIMSSDAKEATVISSEKKDEKVDESREILDEADKKPLDKGTAKLQNEEDIKTDVVKGNMESDKISPQIDTTYPLNKSTLEIKEHKASSLSKEEEKEPEQITDKDTISDDKGAKNELEATVSKSISSAPPTAPTQKTEAKVEESVSDMITSTPWKEEKGSEKSIVETITSVVEEGKQEVKESVQKTEEVIDVSSVTDKKDESPERKSSGKSTPDSVIKGTTLSEKSSEDSKDSKEVSDKSDESIVKKTEHDIESAIDKGVKDVTDIISETKEAITSLFKDSDLKKGEQILEKSANSIGEEFDKVSDMSKSIVFDKCELSPKNEDDLKDSKVGKGDEAKETVLEKSAQHVVNGDDKQETEKYEKILQESVHGIEQTFNNITDMSKSVIFEKCESPTKKEAEKFLETSALSIEEEFEKVSDMSKSIIFEKCESPTKKEAEEKVEKTAYRTEDDFEKVTDMTKSIVFEQSSLSEAKDDVSKLITSDKSEIAKTDKEDKKDTIQLDHKDKTVDTKESDSLDSAVVVESETKLDLLTKKQESIAGPSSTLKEPSNDLKLGSSDDLHLSGKSTPDIADIEKLKESQETLKHEQHIPGSSTPPTVPVSPIIKESSTAQTHIKKVAESTTIAIIKDNELRSSTPASDDYEIGASTHSDVSSDLVSRAPHLLEESERIASEDDGEDDDVPGSPTSMTSQVPHSRSSSRYDFDDGMKTDPMNTSFYGALPDEPEPKKSDETDFDFEKAKAEHRQARGEPLGETSSTYLYEITKAKYSTSCTSDHCDNASVDTKMDQINKNGQMKDDNNVMTSSFIGELPTGDEKDPVKTWGKPLGLPSPAPPTDNRGTPKKERKLPANVTAKNKLNDDRKRSESPSKYNKRKHAPVYVDLTYVPHHGNAYYAYVDFFKRVRARYYVFSGIEPSREVYNALLEAKQTWEDKDLEVTIIPTYDTDILGYWVAENEELLTKYKIDLSPSASRCTINLQDHETSCSAYRLEF